MKVELDCFPCFLRQSLIALRCGTKDRGLQEKILKAVLEDIHATDIARPPAFATTFVHRKIRQLLGRDPFQGIKAEYNRVALGLYPALKEMVRQNPNPLMVASRLAIAGNVIDFGIFTSVDIEGTVERALNNPLTVDDFDLFRAALSGTGEILYLLDNAGEIVFDRILIEELQSLGKKVVAVVKGSPVLNDCTYEDARESGLSDICEIADNGSDAVGTILEWTSDGFMERYARSALVISKGQGNFETLSDPEKAIFYLLQSKCDVISRKLGLSLGSMILSKSRLVLDGQD